MTIPALPALNRASPTFRSDLDSYFLTHLPATTGAINSAIGEIEASAQAADAAAADASDAADAAAGSVSAAAAQVVLATEQVTLANTARDSAQAFASSAINSPGTSATSTTSLTIEEGSKSLTIQTGKLFTVGQWVLISSAANPQNQMAGPITAHDSSSGILTVQSVAVGGAVGPFGDWVVALTPAIPVIEAPRDGKRYLRKDAGWVETAYPIGTVINADMAPTDGTWLPMQGGIYLQASYPELFAKIGLIADNHAAGLTKYANSTSMPSGPNWMEACYGNGTYLAIRQGGQLATSTNGTTWTLRTTPTSKTWSQATYGNGVFLITSDDSFSATSVDGITWTMGAATPSAFIALTSGNGVFVASNTSGNAYVSVNGTTWNGPYATGTTEIREITFCNGKFHTGTRTAGVVLSGTSSNGVTWTTVTYPAAAKHIAYLNGVYVINLFNGGIAYSRNLVDWVRVRLQNLSGDVPLSYLAVVDGMFCGFGDYLFTSRDGANWEFIYNPPPPNSNDARFVNGRYIGFNASDSGLSISNTAYSYNVATQFYIPRNSPLAGQNFIKALA